MMKRTALILLALTLACALGLQGLSFGQKRVEPVEVDLAGIVPAEVAGWTVEDLPIGNTESLRSTAEKMLNYDSYGYRSYTRGSDNISAYIAYWGPGRMDTRLVASHTPDRCWVENGWKITARSFAKPLMLRGMVTQPAEERTFQYGDFGEPQYVYFWQLVGGEVYDFGERLNSRPDIGKYVRDFLRQLKDGKPEQYFIRISSSIPSDRLVREPLFQEILTGLKPIGLEAAANP